ncbi:unnamed protein product [Calypogeia fissa]
MEGLLHAFPSITVGPYSASVRGRNSYTHNSQFPRRRLCNCGSEGSGWSRLNMAPLKAAVVTGMAAAPGPISTGSNFMIQHATSTLQLLSSLKWVIKRSRLVAKSRGLHKRHVHNVRSTEEVSEEESESSAGAEGDNIINVLAVRKEEPETLAVSSLAAMGRKLNPIQNGGSLSNLLRDQLSIARLFLSSIIFYLKIPDQRRLYNLAKNYVRVLFVGLILVGLDLTLGRMSSRRALALPPAPTAESPKGSEVKEAKKFRRRGKSSRETKEVWEGRLSELTNPESGSAFSEQLLDYISVADKKQLEIFLELLKQEANVLRKKVDDAIYDFLATQAELERARDDIVIGGKRALLNEKGQILVSFRRKLLELVAALSKISGRMKELTFSRQAGAEQDALSKQSRIANDLELLKSTLREQNILPEAAKIEPEGAENPAEIQEDKAILQQIELEQKISQKLRDVLEKLVARLYENSDEEDPELEQSMSELRDLVFTDSRWQNEDEETKTALLHNRDINKTLCPKEQVDILVTRDKLLSSTWYNEKKRRWEMEPSAALLAVQKNLAGRARVRHDRRIMYLSLKGDDREYIVNTQAFDSEYEDYGGFDTLLLKLIASGVPTSVEVMWVPLEEWSPRRILQLPFKVIWWLLEDFWNSSLVVSIRPWYYKNLVGAFEEIMVRFGFPLIQRIVPQKIRVLLGFELPEGAEAAEPTNIIIWQQEAQKHVDARYAEGSGSPAWWISLPVRCYVVGMPLFILVKLVVGFAITPFRPQRLAMNDVEWKEEKQEELVKKLDLQPKKQTIDPIRSVFDKMKRVKRPEVTLKDFAGIDVIKEEINEIIRFLKDPKLFKEMGARPPRGVLIVGESGTGKTTLALAIAAEARVPMVELQGSELEGGAWVGQGASNVRELFKTARELAPLIIFMDDFDHFAGVRGATSDTRKQDHESLINQLLVELDGFETQEGVVLVATTSRPFAIDEALRRPGRMDRTIQLPMPNKREREQILRQAAHKTMDADLVDYVDWAKVAEKTAGLTPAHLKYVPEGLEGNAVSFKIADEEELFFIFGWLAALNKGSPKWLKESKFTKRYNRMLIDWLGLRVTKEDMEDAVEYLDVFGESKPGLELYDPPYVWSREFKFPHAVWAAGKGLIALLLPDFDQVDMIWLDPTSWEGIAFTKFTKRVGGGYEETGTLTRSYCEKELVSYFGSFVASRTLLRFGENNSLCKAELESAKEVATRMVMEYGWAPDDSPMIYMMDGSGNSLDIGDKHEEEVAEKINQLFYRALEKASHMLEQNQPALEAMLEHLLEYDALNRRDMRRILEEKGAIFEEAPFSLLPFTHTEIVGISTNGTSRLGKESSLSPVA